MVSLTGSIGSSLGSTLTSLLPIAAIGLGAYLLIKNSRFIGESIGSFAGSGLQNLTSGLTSGFGNIPSLGMDSNPANNPILVAGARLEEAATLDPNLAADRFIDPAGKYDPFSITPKIVESTPQTQTDPQEPRPPVLERGCISSVGREHRVPS